MPLEDVTNANGDVNLPSRSEKNTNIEGFNKKENRLDHCWDTTYQMNNTSPVLSQSTSNLLAAIDPTHNDLIETKDVLNDDEDVDPNLGQNEKATFRQSNKDTIETIQLHFPIQPRDTHSGTQLKKTRSLSDNVTSPTNSEFKEKANSNLTGVLRTQSKPSTKTRKKVRFASSLSSSRRFTETYSSIRNDSQYIKQAQSKTRSEENFRAQRHSWNQKSGRINVSKVNQSLVTMPVERNIKRNTNWYRRGNVIFRWFVLFLLWCVAIFDPDLVKQPFYLAMDGFEFVRGGERLSGFDHQVETDTIERSNRFETPPNRLLNNIVQESKGIIPANMALENQDSFVAKHPMRTSNKQRNQLYNAPEIRVVWPEHNAFETGPDVAVRLGHYNINPSVYAAHRGARACVSLRSGLQQDMIGCIMLNEKEKFTDLKLENMGSGKYEISVSLVSQVKKLARTTSTFTISATAVPVVTKEDQYNSMQHHEEVKKAMQSNNNFGGSTCTTTCTTTCD